MSFPARVLRMAYLSTGCFFRFGLSFLFESNNISRCTPTIGSLNEYPMFKRFIACFVLSALTMAGLAQTTQKVIVAKEDPYNLYHFESSDTSSLFYLKLVPKGRPSGCLVILPASGELVEDVMKQITLHRLAVNKGLLVIFPSINWGSFKFIEENKFLDTVFRQVVKEYHIPKDRFILGGLSGGGMLSLSYAENANRDSSSTFLVPRAVFALDPPLDYTSLYEKAERDVQRNFSPPAVAEGRWLIDNYRKEYGGSPREVPAEYLKYSLYTHSEADGGNAKYLLKTPLRIYTEPAIEWQIKNKHRDLYDMNCTDISAMINLLRNNGNEKAEIIVTNHKGRRPDGSYHPHSWSIMDGSNCLKWILEQLK